MDEVSQLRGGAGSCLLQTLRGLEAMLVDELGDAVRLEGAASGQEFVGDHAQRILVGAAVDVVDPFGLLG